ncbi:large ribosomal subunit protein P1-like [Cynocephalus volans]|uniref:large ribosomal subunit protein P1-like n=1 Tax=Cynocephalus volans TaxID=110931 RepID=UPI002FC6C880
MASISELACIIYSALILHDDEVTITALANVNIGRLICEVGAGGPAPAAGPALVGGPAPSTTAAPAEEKKVEARKEESEESDNDMSFGVFD